MIIGSGAPRSASSVMHKWRRSWNRSPRRPAFSVSFLHAGLYTKQPNPIGCPLGHAAGDSDAVSAVMKEKALKTLQRITSLFDKVFRDLGDAPGDGAREGKSLRQYMAGCHSGRTGWRRAGAYRQSLPLSQRDHPSLLLIQECWS